MLNKLWASPHLVLAGNLGGGEMAAPYTGCAWGSPVQALHIPFYPLPEGPVRQLSEL